MRNAKFTHAINLHYPTEARKLRGVKRFVSTLLFACWAWALALAAMPELHKWAHGLATGHEEHGEREDHECVATLIATGACDAPTVTSLPIGEPVNFAVESWPVRDSEVPPVFLVASPLEHGPPGADA
jgi:hypothetical protein